MLLHRDFAETARQDTALPAVDLKHVQARTRVDRTQLVLEVGFAIESERMQVVER